MNTVLSRVPKAVTVRFTTNDHPQGVNVPKSVYRLLAAAALAAASAGSVNAGIIYEWSGVCVAKRLGVGLPEVPCSETVTGRLKLPDLYVLGTMIDSFDPMGGEAPLLSHKDANIDMRDEDLYDIWSFMSSADGSTFWWSWSASASMASGNQSFISLKWEDYWVDARFTSLRMIPLPSTTSLVGVAMLALAATTGRRRKTWLRPACAPA